MEQFDKIIVKYVALYLRKSRGENESDLYKHETELVDMCVKNNWKYITYKEIESGDSIALRPVMQKLLMDVENEMFDAVCVVDIDRLGRGDLGDQDRIKKAFLRSNTLVVTPQQTYNLNNENDEFAVDMRSFIARVEYKQIVKRLTKGKKIGARLGQWTNGTPPLPYEYERYSDKYNPKGLVINDEKLVIYRQIIESALEGKTPSEIAFELNKQGIKSPRGCNWSNVTVYRLLVDETHLGHIISNKSVGDGHKVKKHSSKLYTKIPKDQWVVVHNCHEPVKTSEEHEKILMLINSRNLYFPRKTIKRTYALSGLVKCGVCGHTMQIYYRPDRRTKYALKPCWYKDSVGNKCLNRGGNLEDIYECINTTLKEYECEIKKLIDESDDQSERLKKKSQIDAIKKRIGTQERTVEFIYEQFEKGLYSESRFKDRRDKAEAELERLKEKLSVLNIQLKNLNSLRNKDRIEAIKMFYETLDNQNLSEEDRNLLYRTIIEKIIYTRMDTNQSPTIEVVYK